MILEKRSQVVLIRPNYLMVSLQSSTILLMPEFFQQFTISKFINIQGILSCEPLAYVCLCSNNGYKAK